MLARGGTQLRERSPLLVFTALSAVALSGCSASNPLGVTGSPNAISIVFSECKSYKLESVTVESSGEDARFTGENTVEYSAMGPATDLKQFDLTAPPSDWTVTGDAEKLQTFTDLRIIVHSPASHYIYFDPNSLQADTVVNSDGSRISAADWGC
jgi:hypothetical protein